jgi:RNA polymerase sigma-70 factor (ECF subfamily)
VSRVKAGDRDAFDELHAHFVNMVHAIVLSHGNARDALDLTQEVFLRVYTDFHRLRSTERAGPWIAAIARNVAIDSLRSRRSSSPLPENVPDPRPSSADLGEAREILDAIRALPETYRETLAMRLVEGMTGPEIADRVGLTHGSVRVHLHRGMKLLTDELARRGIEP